MKLMTLHIYNTKRGFENIKLFNDCGFKITCTSFLPSLINQVASLSYAKFYDVIIVIWLGWVIIVLTDSLF